VSLIPVAAELMVQLWQRTVKYQKELGSLIIWRYIQVAKYGTGTDRYLRQYLVIGSFSTVSGLSRETEK